MMDDIYLKDIYTRLLSGDISVIDDSSIADINIIAQKNLQIKPDIQEIQLLIGISNILYNNTDRDKLPLEDGIYDMLFEYAIKNNIDMIIGAEPIVFYNEEVDEIASSDLDRVPISFVDMEDKIYFKNMYLQRTNIRLNNRNSMRSPIQYTGDIEPDYINKRNVNVETKYPELVGTLLKSKFVLCNQALEKGVLNDSNVRVLERDFFQKHIESGVLDPNRNITMSLEIKYDGVSVEADVSNTVLGARSRGDTSQNLSADMTPILYRYPFVNALAEIPDDNIFGMKFEAIITKPNLEIFNRMKNREYKNCRTAIVGLLSSSDAYKYKDLITLVPLATSLDVDRVTEIEFMNKYYANDEKLRHVIVTGTYNEILFKIKRFVEEAEMMRDYLPFMYDGVVVSYLDEDLIQSLGRENSINLYSEAIKFNPMRKHTIFRGIEYTVGQDGSITPMIYYDPVEFMGTIHDKSTGHSYERFRTLGLRIGDIIDVEYVGDVMPYITKPNNSHNDNNTNDVIEFINNCPECDSELKISASGKTKYCDNVECPGINSARMVNMMSKLNIKDFGEANLEKINKRNLRDLLSITLEEAKEIFPSDIMPMKLMERINEVKTKPMEDYQIVGTLGFNNMAASSWKLILKQYTLDELLNMTQDEILHNLVQVKNIGKTKAEVVAEQLPYFIDDLKYISEMDNVIPHKYNTTSKKIRFTGVRDADLVATVQSMGHDIGEGSVTKDTSILVVPNINFSSGKVDRAKKYGIMILDVNDFRENLETYL